MTVGELMKRLERFNAELHIGVEVNGDFDWNTYLITDKFDLGYVDVDKAGNIQKDDAEKYDCVWIPENEWEDACRGLPDSAKHDPYLETTF